MVVSFWLFAKNTCSSLALVSKSQLSLAQTAKSSGRRDVGFPLCTLVPFVVMIVLDVVHAPLPLERDSRPPPCSMAQSLSSLASRDLLRRQNAADWIPGILGICSTRTKAPLAISKVDGRDGTLCPFQAEKSVRIREVRAGGCVFSGSNRLLLA